MVAMIARQVAAIDTSCCSFQDKEDVQGSCHADERGDPAADQT